MEPVASITKHRSTPFEAKRTGPTVENEGESRGTGV